MPKVKDPVFVGIDMMAWEPGGSPCDWQRTDFTKRSKPTVRCESESTVILSFAREYYGGEDGHRRDRVLELPLCRKHLASLVKHLVGYLEEEA